MEDISLVERCEAHSGCCGEQPGMLLPNIVPKAKVIFSIDYFTGVNVRQKATISYHITGKVTRYTPIKLFPTKKNSVSLLGEALLKIRNSTLYTDTALFRMLESSIFIVETLSDNRKTSLSVDKALSKKQNSTLSLSGLLHSLQRSHCG